MLIGKTAAIRTRSLLLLADAERTIDAQTKTIGQLLDVIEKATRYLPDDLRADFKEQADAAVRANERMVTTEGSVSDG